MSSKDSVECQLADGKTVTGERCLDFSFRGNYGCLLFFIINRLECPADNGKSFFPKSGNQSNEMALTICNCFRQMRDWKMENLASGKELSTVPIGTEKENYLCR